MFRVGRGIADITGEAAECGLLGYGRAEQQASGLHTRLRSRAFVIVDEAGARVLLVVNELPLPLDSVTDAVLAGLADRFGGLYRADNTMLTVTHTHCAPGGYSHHVVYNSNTGGFRPRTFAAIVDGTLDAVERAHADIAPSELVLTRGELHGASVNRSPTAFERNPAHERAAFPDGIDPRTTMLRIERGGRFVGGVNWFATHGTSMSNTNTLISSDNKGYAAYHWERLVAGVDYRADERPAVITAFAQTNSGDMSPNLHRAPGSGPTEDEVENTRLIGLRQYEAAARLAAEPGERLDGTIDARMTRVDLGDVEVDARFTGDGRPHRTGRPVAAAAQFAGTDEGPGFAGFRQGVNPVWDALSRRVLYPLAPRLRAAHAPKAMVLPAWLINRAVPMIAERVPVQLLRIGRLYLLGMPAEVTVVAGLRLRRTVAAIVGADVDDVLVAGYANAYVHYVTTPQEYDAQRYEAGSTMFGRWELAALQQVAAGLAQAMATGRPAPDGSPTGPTGNRWRWRRAPGADDPGPGAFGRVVIEPGPLYRPGDSVISVFVSAHLAHDVRRGDTFAEIQRDDSDAGSGGAAAWTTVADDGDWETTVQWMRVGRAGSRVTVSWVVPPDVRPGGTGSSTTPPHETVRDTCSRSPASPAASRSVRLGAHMIDIAVIATVFALIFVGELPDKTAVAGLVLGTKYPARWVWTGMAAAFLVHVVIAVAAGSLIALLPRRPVEFVVAALFLLGAVLLWREASGGDEDDDEDGRDVPEDVGFVKVASLGFGVILVAEFGDLTQILTANLAAHYRNPVSVAIGAVLALWAVAALAIVGGRTLLRVLPIGIIVRIAAVVMVGLAAYSIYTALHG